MPAPGVMKVRIGTDTQTNTPVKQVAFRFNGMSGPGPASSDQMLRVGNVRKHLKGLPWPGQDDKAGEYTKAQLDQMSVEARLTNPVGFWPKTALARVALASFLPGAGLGKFTGAAWDLERPLETFCLSFRSGCFLRNPMVSCWVPLYVDRRLGRTRASTPAAARPGPAAPASQGDRRRRGQLTLGQQQTTASARACTSQQLQLVLDQILHGRHVGVRLGALRGCWGAACWHLGGSSLASPGSLGRLLPTYHHGANTTTPLPTAAVVV